MLIDVHGVPVEDQHVLIPVTALAKVDRAAGEDDQGVPMRDRHVLMRNQPDPNDV